MRFSTLLFVFSLLLSAGYALGADDEEVKEPKPLQYHELSPSLISNLQSGAKYMRCDVQLVTDDAESLEQIALHAPVFRHELLLLMSDQEGKELKLPKGKEKFRKSALKALRSASETVAGKTLIVDLYFTSFFVQ